MGQNESDRGMERHPGNRVVVVDESSILDRLSGEIRDNLEKEFSKEEAAARKQQGAGEKTEESGAQDTEPRYRVVNVMWEILRHTDVVKTMKKLGMCTCGQCRAEVLAHCLSALPSKYVAAREDSAAASVTLYEYRYSTSVRTALLQACEEVRAHPRHSGQQG